MTPKTVLADPKSQINLAEGMLSRAVEEASRIGISPEILVTALLQVFHDADESFKVELARHLESLRNPSCA